MSMRYLVLVPALILLSSCHANPWKRTLLHSHAPVAVYMEHEERGGKQVPHTFAHPPAIAADQVKRLFQGLRFTSWGIIQGTRTAPILEDAELQALAEPLVRALGRASPDERVRFLVLRTAWRPLFGGVRGTSGVVFFTEPDRINVAFDLLDDTLADDGGDPRAVVFHEDPVEITGARPEIEAPAWAEIRQGAPGGKVYPRWVIASLAQIAAATPAPSRPEPAALPTATSPPPAVPATAADRSAEKAETAAQALKHRLLVLDKLRADGTITAEEYEKARQQILLQSER